MPGFVDDLSVANVPAEASPTSHVTAISSSVAARLQRHGEHDNAALVAVWLAVPTNDRVLLEAIKPLVAQHHVIGDRMIDTARAAAFAVRASHLEKVSEIGIEVQCHRRLDRFIAVAQYVADNARGDSLAPMPQPRKSAARAGSPAAEATDEETRSTLVSIRDLLARSVMLSSDRIRETLDDAVRRGRITRADAEELVDRSSSSAASRPTTPSRASRRSPAPRAAGERARSAVRRTPGTDRVLREVDKVRRTAGSARRSRSPATTT